MNKSEERGKLLYVGIQGRSYYDTHKGAKIRLAWIIFALCFATFMAIISFMGYFSIAGSIILSGILFSLLAIYISFGVIGWGLEVDAIYENGITNYITLLHESLLGKSFHFFKDITKIGYGKHDFSIFEKNSDFIVIYENNSIHPTVRHFHRSRYKNDFYQRLIEVLKEKCPNAKWEPVDLDKIPFWYK